MSQKLIFQHLLLADFLMSVNFYLKTAFWSQERMVMVYFIFRPIIGPALPPGFIKSSQKSDKGREDPAQVSPSFNSEVWKVFA